MAARRQVLRLAARALEQRLNADTGDHPGPELPCPCGGSAQYQGRHEKTFESALGPLRLERAYYHGERCQSGFCPRDRALGLQGSSLTRGVLRMTASAAVLVSFAESSGLLHELAGVEVSAKQVERVAEALGAEIAVDERQPVEKMSPVAPTMYLGMDGTGVPMRTPEVAGRAGKQPDGSAKTREAKVVTIWTAESRDPEVSRSGIRDQLPTRRRSKVPPLGTPALSFRTSPRASCARLLDAASPKLPGRWCWAMVRPGSGTPLPNYFPRRFRFSTGFMPKSTSASWARSSSPAAKRLRHRFSGAMKNSMRAA